VIQRRGKPIVAVEFPMASQLTVQILATSRLSAAGHDRRLPPACLVSASQEADTYRSLLVIRSSVPGSTSARYAVVAG
jgi:hypothetical protein